MSPLVQSLRIPISNREIKRRRSVLFFYHFRFKDFSVGYFLLFIHKKRLKNHVIQSILYVINLTIGYFLMNIAMCYYAGHFIAIIFGNTKFDEI
jgi:hypothetical protein